MSIEGTFDLIPKIGDGLSWVTQNVVQYISMYGVEITPLQSKVILLIILGVAIYLLFSVITIARKILKWGIISLLGFLAISVLLSMFV